jgi:ribosomal protein L7Ae-like RNA K-turn-binding protein
MNEPLTSLGLALRAGKLAAGEEAVNAALSAGTVRLVVLASDAGENTVRRMEHRSRGKLPILYLEADKASLGQAVGWKSCAAAALTDLGMAAAFAGRLAALDERHRGALEALQEKQEKIARRRLKKPGKRSRSK